VTEPIQKIREILGPHLDAPENRTRSRIIGLAGKRFLVEGFARVTVEDLCHDLRMSKKTFYKYFQGKEDLVLGVFGDAASVLMPKIGELISSEAPPRERMNLFTSLILDVVMKRLSSQFLADVQALMPELWEAIDGVRMFNMLILFKIIREGQEEGIFRRDMDAEKLARVITLIIQRVADPAVLYESGVQIQDLAFLLLNMLQHGILAGPRDAEEKDEKA